MYTNDMSLCYQCRRQRSKKTKSQLTPALSAGEAIERMLVERKISTKINYDVLRDLANDLAMEGDSTVADQSLPTNAATSQSSLTISRSPPSTIGRLPSLTTRKRKFSALMAEAAPADLPSQPPAKSVYLLQNPSVFNDFYNFCCRFAHASVTSNMKPKQDVLEEVGPVDYCGNDEAVCVDETDLAYESDPLLLSDFEDEGNGYYYSLIHFVERFLIFDTGDYCETFDDYY